MFYIQSKKIEQEIDTLHVTLLAVASGVLNSGMACNCGDESCPGSIRVYGDAADLANQVKRMKHNETIGLEESAQFITHVANLLITILIHSRKESTSFSNRGAKLDYIERVIDAIVALDFFTRASKGHLEHVITDEIVN